MHPKKRAADRLDPHRECLQDSREQALVVAERTDCHVGKSHRKSSANSSDFWPQLVAQTCACPATNLVTKPCHKAQKTKKPTLL